MLWGTQMWILVHCMGTPEFGHWTTFWNNVLTKSTHGITNKIRFRLCFEVFSIFTFSLKPLAFNCSLITDRFYTRQHIHLWLRMRTWLSKNVYNIYFVICNAKSIWQFTAYMCYRIFKSHGFLTKFWLMCPLSTNVPILIIALSTENMFNIEHLPGIIKL